MPLVVTRRPGEVLFVGDDVMVEILSVVGNQIRIRVSAPLAKSILRGEMLRPPERQTAERAAGYTPAGSGRRGKAVRS